MSKRLPYYQSEPAEYLAGDIMYCSYGAQGVFTIIRALYWQKDCSLTLDQAKRRITDADVYFDELIKENIIKIKDNNISITFLDNQLKDASKKSTTNSSNGKKGAEARWGKNSEIIARPFLNDGETYGESMALREDKIKEDNTNTTKHQTFTNQCLEQSSWCESISMREKIAPDKIQLALKDFNGHLTSIGDEKQYLKDYQYHFVMWVKKRKAVN